MDNRQKWVVFNKTKKYIKETFNIQAKSGIYIFERINEDNEYCYYIGQSTDILRRCTEHCFGREQHIDKSIYTHKLYSSKYPNGWKIRPLIYCAVQNLDDVETYYIVMYRYKIGKCYNVSGGGQGDRAKDVGKRFEKKLKTYKNGKLLAERKTIEKIKTFFDKYLDFTIKGKPTKIKERKYNEFKDMIGDNENE